MFFFFQAEDGIRDYKVTGVQTCALPISVGQLAYHAFRLSIAFADAMDRGEMPEGWLQEQAPPDMLNSVAIASYGALVRARLRGWFEATPESDYARIVAVYYGPQSGHALLE